MEEVIEVQRERLGPELDQVFRLCGWIDRLDAFEQLLSAEALRLCLFVAALRVAAVMAEEGGCDHERRLRLRVTCQCVRSARSSVADSAGIRPIGPTTKIS